MGLSINIIMEGHDWENNLHYGCTVPLEVSAFERYPEFIYHRLEQHRKEMEIKYKKDFIEKGLHIKLINNPT